MPRSGEIARVLLASSMLKVATLFACVTQAAASSMYYGLEPDSSNSVIMTIPKVLALSPGMLVDLLPFNGIVWEVTEVLPMDDHTGPNKVGHRLTTINEW